MKLPVFVVALILIVFAATLWHFHNPSLTHFHEASTQADHHGE